MSTLVSRLAPCAFAALALIAAVFPVSAKAQENQHLKERSEESFPEFFNDESFDFNLFEGDTYNGEKAQHRKIAPDGLEELLEDSLDFNFMTAGQAIGNYDHGRLQAPAMLPTQGYGFVRLFQPRNRGYGTNALVRMIQYLAKEMKNRYPKGERLQTGDLSQKQGGEISSHASHQIGLDVDLAFFKRSQTEQDPQITTGFQYSLVANGKVLPDFDMERNFEMARLMVGARADTAKAARIFVNPLIKKAFCQYSKTKAANTPYDSKKASVAETLRRLRPWPGHTDHFHLRLTCPKSSPRCVGQEEVDPGTGC